MDWCSFSAAATFLTSSFQSSQSYFIRIVIEIITSLIEHQLTWCKQTADTLLFTLSLFCYVYLDYVHWANSLGCLGALLLWWKVECLLITSANFSLVSLFFTWEKITKEHFIGGSKNETILCCRFVTCQYVWMIKYFFFFLRNKFLTALFNIHSF